MVMKVTNMENVDINSLVGNLVEFKGEYFQYNTKNKSFIKVLKDLSEEGIKNNMFMLKLINKDLAYIDPFDKKLSANIRYMVLQECANNIWYFFREIYRNSIQGDEESQYIMNLGNLATIYLHNKNITSYTSLARHNYSDMTIQGLIIFRLISKIHNNMIYLDKSFQRYLYIMDVIRNSLSCMPDYISNLIRWKNNLMHSDITCSTIRGTPRYKSKTVAKCNGRSLFGNMIICDNFEFTDYSYDLLETILPILSTNNFFMTIYSCAGDLSINNTRKIFDNIISKSVKWENILYDLDINELKEYIAFNSMTPFIYLNFDWKSLKLSEEWFNYTSKSLNNDLNIIGRELNLKRI